MRSTGVTYVILGMLQQHSRSGYDIKRFADASTRFFWSTSYGQIYPELRRLEQEGLIERERVDEGGRRRTVYRLTRAGEAALLAWLRAPEDSVHEIRDEAMLRLFFADALPREDALEIVRAMRRRHEVALARLRGLEGVARSMRQRFPYITLQAGIELQTALVRWCARTERELLDSSEAVA